MNETTLKYNRLVSARDLLTAQINQFKIEREVIIEQIAEIEWVKIKWDELKELLISQYPQNEYSQNPTVIDKYKTVQSYCFITKEGELQIGGFFNNDHFPRGEDLYIHFQRKPFNSLY